MSYILPHHLPKRCVKPPQSLGGVMFFLLLRFWKDSGDRDFITVETVTQQFSPGDLRTKKQEFKECSHINVRKVLCCRIQAYLCDKQSCVLVINFSFNNQGISFLYCCDSSLLSMLSFAPMLFFSTFQSFSHFIWHGSRMKFMYAPNSARLFGMLFTELPEKEIWLNFTLQGERMRLRGVI